MHPTITQNSALYFAQHRPVNRRTGFLRQWWTSNRKGLPRNHRRLLLHEFYIVPRSQQANSR